MIQNEKCTVLIPARMESSRLPGKPIIKIHGVPMIVHVAKRCELYANARDVIVCTDSAAIIIECEKYGVKCFNTRNSHRNGTSRIAEVASKLDINKNEIIIDVQGDEPLVTPSYVQKVHEFMMTSSHGCCVPYQISEEFNNPNRVKIVSSGDKIIYFTRSDAPHYFSTPFEGFKKHLSIIGFTKETLQNYTSLPIGDLERIEQIELFRLIENNVSIGTFKMKGNSTSVDTQKDLEHVVRTMEHDEIYCQMKSVLNVK